MERESYAVLSIPEIIDLIFNYLHWKTIPIAPLVCKQWLNVSKNNKNIKYKYKYFSEFGGPLRTPNKEDYDEKEYQKRLQYLSLDWRRLYSAMIAKIDKITAMRRAGQLSLRQSYSLFTEWALHEGHYNFMEKLIREQKYSTKYYEGDPVLEVCLRNNDTKTFKVIMKHKKEYFERDLFPRRGQPSLQHEATRSGNFKFLKLLLDTGVDIDHYQNQAGTCILVALNESSEEIVLLLLERGADLMYVFTVSTLEGVIDLCATKLWARAIIAFIEIERKLREDGLMFVKSTNSYYGTTQIKEDYEEFLKYITNAIHILKQQEQSNEASSAIQLLQNYFMELQTKLNETVKALKNMQIVSTDK